ncbi:unnamed protein product [Penicillium camemberti]|uniref:Str. FM013 n=1 Tax=Penicillium camemberti (strain FM 013) TaxID=1429867 RepID=A0A0G4PNQ4_PENC3|nr:unnamed protein product [Penicillium camemberti]
MALTPFGVIVSIQIDGAYEDELVHYAYSVALGTPEEKSRSAVDWTRTDHNIGFLQG